MTESKNVRRSEMMDVISCTEAEIFPYDKMGLVVTSFLVTICTPFILGGKTMPSIFGIEKCTLGYFFWSLIYVLIVIFLWRKACNIVYQEQEYKKTVPGLYPYEEPVVWDYPTMTKVGIYFCGVGCFASLVGMGGGVYIVPMLVRLGYPPSIVAATSLFLVFWSKFAAMILFLINGSLPYDFSLFLGMFAVVGSYISIISLRRLLQQVKRQSIISMIFVGFTVLATGMTIFKLCQILFEDHHGTSIMIFGSYCS